MLARPVQRLLRPWASVLPLVAFAMASVLAGCGAEYLLSPRRYATVWTQSSGEYAATTLQVYYNARIALEAALADDSWTACIEQTGEFAALPPAIMVDLDETVLDNTRFHAMLDRNQLAFNEELWADWVHEAKATAVPGAVPFLKFAESKGVEIFYVTNRLSTLEESTRENLRALDLPLREDSDTLFTRFERPEWGREKTTRREAIARSHRVLIIVGDALGDFTAVDDDSPEGRRDLALRHTDKWGRRWFMLPNPIYGGWAKTIDQTLPPRLPQE